MRGRATKRAVRVGDQIQRELAGIVIRDLADPAIGPATLSGVDLSPDFRQAKVYVTPAGNSDGHTTLRALNRAAGFLRRRLGARIHLKVLPQLRFVYDPTLDEAQRISALLDEARSRDEERANPDEGCLPNES